MTIKLHLKISEIKNFLFEITGLAIDRSAIRNLKSKIKMAEGAGFELARDSCSVVFGTTALPVRLTPQDDFRYWIADFD
jgi:hypothetical protein